MNELYFDYFSNIGGSPVMMFTENGGLSYYLHLDDFNVLRLGENVEFVGQALKIKAGAVRISGGSVGIMRIVPVE